MKDVYELSALYEIEELLVDENLTMAEINAILEIIIHLYLECDSIPFCTASSMALIVAATLEDNCMKFRDLLGMDKDALKELVIKSFEREMVR